MKTMTGVISPYLLWERWTKQTLSSAEEIKDSGVRSNP